MNGEDVEAPIRAAMAAGDWVTVDRLAPELDRVFQPVPPVAMLSAALWYAGHGLRVFPLQAGQKIPHRGTKGCHDASDDPARLRAWWERWPRSNVGIATGHLVDVIDIDGPAGAASWARMENIPPLFGVVSTPRPGGSHLYVAATGEGNRAGLAEGVDYRGKGGYVVAPPSMNTEGVRYRWRRPLAVPAEVCAVCGEAMVVVEAGQSTHPACEAVA